MYPLEKFDLGELSLKTIAIRVKNRDLLIHFYRDIIGFHLLREENELAILGYKEPYREILWLEESPRAEEHFGEVKRLARISLVVPNEEELANVYARIKKNDYEVKSALASGEEKGLLVEDPEGNQLEIFYAPSKERSTAEIIQVDFEKLLKKATNKEKIHEAYFDKVHLNVNNLAQQEKFLEEVLGLKTQTETDKVVALNRGDFNVGLSEVEGGVIDLPTDKVLGLDFLQFKISQEDLIALIANLEKEEREFFADKKQTLVTIYDPIGIEWWFVTSWKL